MLTISADGTFNRSYLLLDRHSSKTWHLMDLPSEAEDGRVCIHDLETGMLLNVFGEETNASHSHYWGDDHGSLSVSEMQLVRKTSSEMELT